MVFLVKSSSVYYKLLQIELRPLRNSWPSVSISQPVDLQDEPLQGHCYSFTHASSASCLYAGGRQLYRHVSFFVRNFVHLTHRGRTMSTYCRLVVTHQQMLRRPWNQQFIPFCDCFVFFQ